jgi:hypothetical protein
MILNWRPLAIDTGSFTIPVRNVVFVSLTLFILVRLYVVLKRNGPSN